LCRNIWSGGWNDDLKIPNSLEEEIAQAFINVERTLATAGASWEQVVHVNSYHVGGFPNSEQDNDQPVSPLYASPGSNMDTVGS
jgi:hypothetical protein